MRARAAGSIFEELHEHESGGALAQHLARATEASFGTPGRAWLEHLIETHRGAIAHAARAHG
jgi:hypothetical protein